MFVRDHHNAANSPLLVGIGVGIGLLLPSMQLVHTYTIGNA